MTLKEYELYKLTKPSFKLNENFSTEAKHRDPVETLVLGRNGIGGGGDTPKQETLWAIEFESGKFAFGHASENAIFVATSSVGREIWYADADGVVTGNTPTADNVASAIIDAYNEHFGTVINIWTPETKTLQVGDTVPNWNAYEKIEISSRKIAFNIQSTSPIYIFGTIEGNILHLEVDNREQSWRADTEGNIIDSSGPGIQEKTSIIQQFGNKGISISDVVANRVQYDEGDIIPNWSEYEKIE